MRRRDWELAVEAVIAEARRSEFVWGRNDGATFGARILQAVMGYDALQDFLGSYADRLAGYRILARYGGYRKAVTKRLAAYGIDEINPLLAHRGDLALVSGNGIGEALGVVMGSRIILLAQRGVIDLPRSAALTAWRLI